MSIQAVEERRADQLVHLVLRGEVRCVRGAMDNVVQQPDATLDFPLHCHLILRTPSLSDGCWIRDCEGDRVAVRSDRCVDLPYREVDVARRQKANAELFRGLENGVILNGNLNRLCELSRCKTHGSERDLIVDEVLCICWIGADTFNRVSHVQGASRYSTPSK